MLHNKIAILGTHGGIDSPGSYDLDELIKIAGLNTGNFAFQRAANELIGAEKICFGPSGVNYTETKRLRECDYLVFPAANHMRMNADWTGLSNFIRNAPVPLIILGLGAQAPHAGGSDEIIQEMLGDANLQDFADALKKKAVLVTTRGAFSQRVCEAFELPNVRQLGCPSLLLNGNPTLGQELGDRLAEANAAARYRALKFVMAAESPFAVKHDSRKRTTEQTVFDWLVKGDGLYVQQSGGRNVMAFARANLDQVTLNVFFSIKEILAPGMTLDAFSKFMCKRQRLFWSVDEWQAAVKPFELSVGPRLHGNMIAISQTVPAIFLPHDSRTSELVETMRMPYVPQEVVATCDTMADLLDNVVFDADTFDRNRTEIAQAYRNIFTKLGIAPGDRLRSFQSF